MAIATRTTRRFVPALLALTVGLAGCAMSPEQIYQTAIPKAPAQRTVTPASAVLSCMDDLFYSYGVRDIRISTTGIPDATGEITAGTRDMLIAAVGRMSQRSRAFTFVDLEVQTSMVGAVPDQRLYNRMGNSVVPAYYIRGSISSYDESVGNDTFGIGINIANQSAGVNKDTTSSVIGVDMNVGEVANSLIVPGVASSNRLVVSRSSLAADASYDVKVDGEDVAGYLQASRTKAEGMHTGVRSLIEYGAVETLGKLTRVPYWRCMGVNQADPSVAQKASSYFTGMSDEERTSFVQRSLTALNLYRGEIDGRTNAALADAVGQYQAKNNLVANGRIDSQLYASLLGEDIKLAGPGAPPVGSGQDFKAAVQDKLYIALTDPQGLPTYPVGRALQLTARINADAYMYCYYQAGAGGTARIFPNRFQAGPMVSGGKATYIPEADAAGSFAKFALTTDTKGVTEKIRCFASRKDIGLTLPEALQAPDLTPLAYKSLDEIERALRAAGPDDMVASSIDFIVR